MLPQVEWILRCPESKEGQIFLPVLGAGSSFISKDEWVSESPVDTLEKALGPRLIWKGASHPLTLQEARGI